MSGTREVLTVKQAKVLSYIDQVVSRQGRPPTLREIAAHFGFRALGTVEDYLRILSRKGYLQRQAYRACGLQLKHRVENLSIPILGTVPAGKPLESYENSLGSLPFPGSTNRGQLFALRVQGESMIGAGILDGDYVVVKKQLEAEDGELVVVLIDGEATVKRLEKRANKVRLIAENPKFAPIELQPGAENLIQGKVVSVQRYYGRGSI
jgi:repressor LexA